MLKLLAQVDDEQIIILASYLHKHNSDDDFFERHKTVLALVSRQLGVSEDEIEAVSMYDLARAELLGLGLLRAHYRSTKKGELPEFDSGAGMLNATGQREQGFCALRPERAHH